MFALITPPPAVSSGGVFSDGRAPYHSYGFFFEGVSHPSPRVPFGVFPMQWDTSLRGQTADSARETRFRELIAKWRFDVAVTVRPSAEAFAPLRSTHNTSIPPRLVWAFAHGASLTSCASAYSRSFSVLPVGASSDVRQRLSTSTCALRPHIRCTVLHE